MTAAADDGTAKLFKYEDDKLKCLQSHSTHKELSRDKFKISAIAISSDDRVVTGDDYGNLVIWDTAAQQTRNLNLSKNSIIVMKSHPKNPDLIAFGCRLGLVYVVNINGKGQILQKIRAHDEDIQGIDWCHEEVPEIFKDTEEEHTILAVASRDRTISIWSTKTGSVLARLSMPSSRCDNPWISLNWYQTSLILVSGSQGDLCQWDLSKLSRKFESTIKSNGSGEEFKYLHNEHQKNLFCISSHGDFVVTCGYDRSIVCFKPMQNQLVFNLPTFASRITCMVQNVQDPSIVALGSGDGQIRIWKMNSNKAMFDYSIIWQKLNRSEVLAMAWHPAKDNQLAFATDEGRIGFVDAFSQRPQVNFSEFKHRTSVYNLVYGPTIMDEDTSNLSLYSLGDGLIMMHGRGKVLNIEEIIAQTNDWQQRKAPSRSEIAFETQEKKLVALGCDDGTVEIFALPDLKIGQVSQ